MHSESVREMGTIRMETRFATATAHGASWRAPPNDSVSSVEHHVFHLELDAANEQRWNRDPPPSRRALLEVSGIAGPVR